MYKLLFYAKGTSKSIPQAIRLSKKLKASIDEKKKQYTLEFQEFKGDFKKLVSLVKNLRETELYYNDNEIDDIELYVNILSCPRKRSCKGVCILDDNYKEIFQCIGLFQRPSFTCYNEYIFESLGNPELILDIKDDQQLTIDTEILKDQYFEDTKLQKVFAINIQ
jgi:hypothetical protein